MSITFTLPVPLKNQLGEPTSDGRPAENDHYDCVATSLASGLQFLLKRPFNGDALKDTVYGQSYQGGMAAVRFVDYCARLGVSLTPFNGSQTALVAMLHREVHAGHPCLVTMPSQWGSAPSQPGWNPVAPNGWTHVALCCGDGPAMLRDMNPWGGFWHDGTDAYWLPRLCYGQIWVLALKGATTVGIPAGWHDDGTTLVAPNGHKVVLGFRKYVLSQAWAADNIPLEDEEHRAQVEWHNASLGGAQRQIFRRTVLRWDASGHAMEEDLGAELQALEAQYAQVNTALAAANAQIAQLKQQLAAAQAGAQPDPLAAEALDVMKRQSALFAKLIPNAIRTATGGAIQP